MLTVAMYTESNKSKCCDIATINIGINDCIEDIFQRTSKLLKTNVIECTQTIILENILDIIIKKFPIVKVDDEDVRINWLLEIPRDLSGDFEVSTINRKLYILAGYTTEVMITGRTKILNNIQKFLKEQPNGNFTIILTENAESDDYTWGKKLASGIIKQSNKTNHVSVINIPIYNNKTIYKDIRYYARKISKFIQENKIPSNKLNIVGFGINSLLAYYLRPLLSQHKTPVARITVLNPPAAIFTNAPPNMVTDVNSTTSVVSLYTTINDSVQCCNLGQVNIFINNPLEIHPSCLDEENPEKCTFNEILKDMFVLMKPNVTVIDEDGNKYPLLKLPLDIKGNFTVMTVNRDVLLEIFVKANFKVVSGGFSIGKIKYGRESIVDDLKIFQNEHAQGNYTIILDGAEKINRGKWASELMKQILKNSKGEFVTLFNYSSAIPPNVKDTNARAIIISKLIREFLNVNNIPPKRLRIIGHKDAALISYHLNKLLEKDCTFILKIINVNPTSELQQIMVSESSKFRGTKMINLISQAESSSSIPQLQDGVLNLIINNATVVQPDCKQAENPEQCSDNIGLVTILDSFENVISAICVTGDGFIYNILEIPPNIYVGEFQVIRNVWVPPPPEENEVPSAYEPPSDIPNSPPNLKHGNDSMNPESKVLIKYTYPNGTRLVLDLTMKSQEGLVQFLRQPYRRIIFIIINKQQHSDESWPEQIKDQLQSVAQTTESVIFPIVIDWTRESKMAQHPTARAYKVARDVLRAMIRLDITARETEIIAFGESAHLAGIIGQICKVYFHAPLLRIIALQPTKLVEFKDRKVNHRLHKSDAVQVISVVTETTKYGECCGDEASVQVIVGDPENGQTWCKNANPNPPKPKESDDDDNLNEELDASSCSHESATNIFIKSYTLRPVKIVNYETNELLQNFPYNVATNISGIYLMPIKNYNPMHPDEIEPSKPVYPNGSSLEGKAYYPGGSYSWENGIKGSLVKDLTLLIKKNHKVMIIITGGDKSHLSWTTELANLTDHILIVKSYDAYYKQCMEGDHKILVKVAEQIANEIKLLEIKPSNLTLAGFGVSAHLAGLVSRLVKEKLNHVDQIIALNPNMDHSFKLPEKVKLKPNDAKHVMVLNTQADDEYVCCSLDLVTVMVNNPYTTQPGCELGDKECSNAFAIRVFLQAAKLQGNITLPLKQFTGTRLKGFPLNIKYWNTGVYYYIVDSDGKPMPDKKINVIMVGGYESSLLQSTNKLGEFSIIKSFLSSNLKNPRIFVIFETGDQSDKSWGRKMIEVIRRTSPEPALVLVVPINAYPNIEQTLKYQDHIVKNVYTILSKSKVRGEHLTIIGFGIGTVYSTRLTKIYLKLNEQNQQNTKVAVLIALNPAAALYTKIFGVTPGIPDAKLVMNIHTEGKHLGHCCGASDIHVKVNDPFNIQPACKKVPAQSVLCSFRALSLYMIRAFGNDITNLPILEDSKFELAGWPYCKKEAKHGIYYIGAYRAELQGPVFIQYNRSPILPPVLGPNDFVIIPKVIKEFKSRVYIIIGSGDHSDHVLYNLDILQHQLRQGSQAGAYVISIPWDTAFQIRNSSLLSSSKNWGEFIRKSETISLLKRVAKDQAKSLVKSLLKYKLKLARTTIIAHGENGLLASLMCKEFRRITGSVPFRVIYLNILSNLFDPSLVSKNEMPSSSDGTTVLSIYTEKKKYGYCCDLGGLDIQIYPKNNSTEYPICSNTTDKEFCAHNMALEYLIRLIEYQYNDAHLPRLKIDGFPLKYNPKIKGTFHIYPNDVVKESWKLPDLQVSNTSEGVNHNLIVFRNLLKEYPLYQLLIILADSQSSKHFPGWPEQIEKIVKKKTADFRAKLFVYVLNWNTAIVGDEYPDHKAHTQDFVESIRNAKYIVSELKQASVPSENVNILGFGPSAMMAHLIGVLYRPRQIIHMNPHFIWFEDYRHLYNMYDSKPELRIKKLNHETFEIAQSVLVIQSESRKYGYCCEAGHVRVLINNPVVGQSWCARDRFCSYMSVISVFIDSLRNAPARVFNVNDPSEHLDGFPFWYDLDDENTYMMTTRYSGSIEHNPSGLVSPDEMKVEYSFTKEDINVWYKLNPKGRLYLVATDDTSGDRKWDRKLSRALKSVNVTNKVVVADWSRHIKLGITEETLNASRHLAKNIGSLLEESDYPAHQTTIIGFGLASLLASKIAKQIHILSATPIHQIFFLNPTKNIFDHKLVPEKDMPAITDANMVLLVETETSTIGMKDSVEKAVRVLVNNPDKPQPICSSAGKELYAQCSHRFAITFFISAHTKKVNAIEKGTGKILKNFPLEIDATLKGIGGVYYVNTTTQESGPNASTTMTPLLTTTPAQHSLFSSISTFPPIITDNKGSPESED
ncbi:uncharacterized protein LOC126740557 [Anthonomus grandis grandis]|uniref:uncharacterized protein LOC126740557 n=1 Tax=Anthonomus grandis grandis TaxID=2921223 RepID=UPI002165A5BE|nr:uncharacterized protein LOC126740557 [Anthonomus grandis grandis]